MKKIIFIITLAILFAGCVGENNKKDNDIQNLSETEQKLVNLAKEDLADILQISVNDIKLSKIEKTTWGDSSLGYPEPDGVYTPVEIPGYIIELSYKDNIYEYHSNYERVVAPP